MVKEEAEDPTGDVGEEESATDFFAGELVSEQEAIKAVEFLSKLAKKSYKESPKEEKLQLQNEALETLQKLVLNPEFGGNQFGDFVRELKIKIEDTDTSEDEYPLFTEDSSAEVESDEGSAGGNTQTPTSPKKEDDEFIFTEDSSAEVENDEDEEQEGSGDGNAELHSAAAPSDPAVQDAGNVAQQRGIKRKANRSRNARKVAVVRGNKGRPVAARKTGSDCGCGSECLTKVGKEEMQSVSETFKSIEIKDLQNMYLRGLIVGKEPKRRGAAGSEGPNKPGKKRQRLVYEYYVLMPNLTRTEVCKKAFISIHGITESRVKTVRVKVVPIDMRGRHDNRPNRITKKNGKKSEGRSRKDQRMQPKRKKGKTEVEKLKDNLSHLETIRRKRGRRV